MVVRMEIIEQTNARLVARERNSSYVAGILFGLAIAAIGGFIATLPGGPAYPVNNTSISAYLAFGIALVIAGAAFILIRNRRTSITIDLATNKARVEDAGLLLKDARECDLNQTSALELNEYVSGGKRKHHRYALEFALSDGKKLRLISTADVYQLRLPFTGKNDMQMLQDLGQAIAKFTGKPYRENRNPTLSEILDRKAI